MSRPSTRTAPAAGPTPSPRGSATLSPTSRSSADKARRSIGASIRSAARRRSGGRSEPLSEGPARPLRRFRRRVRARPLRRPGMVDRRRPLRARGGLGLGDVLRADPRRIFPEAEAGPTVRNERGKWVCDVCGIEWRPGRAAGQWDTKAAGREGWFFQRDDSAFCPKHVPEWVPAWRQKRLAAMRDEGSSYFDREHTIP